MENPTNGLTRRSVAKGAAWAAPTLAVASVAPAFAASRCSTRSRLSGGLKYAWGQLSSTTSPVTTNQTLDAGGQTFVTGLPAGVTVQKVEYQWWIQNRQGQQSTHPGAFWVGNSRSDRASNTAAMTYSHSRTAAGWTKTVSNTVNNSSHTFTTAGGLTYPAFDLNFTWEATAGAGTYTESTTSPGCYDFTTGPSGRFLVNYNGVPAISYGDCQSGNAVVVNEVDVKITLSDGQILTFTQGSDGGTNCANQPE